MASLAEIYGCVKSVALKDEKGIYLDGEKVALDNSANNGYIRRNGARTLSGQNGCGGDLDSELPLLFVGAAPMADAGMLEIATIAALISTENVIVSSEIDKVAIAESEGIPLEELTKFDGVAMVMVEYNQITKEVYDPRCDYDVCS